MACGTPSIPDTWEVCSVSNNLLEVRDLRTSFVTESGPAYAVDGLSFDLAAGETLAIVGESGCGKSVTSLSLLGLVPSPGRVEGGTALYRGEDLLQKSEDALRAIRGREIAMIFQEPVSALNPVLTIGRQLAESFVHIGGMTPKAAREQAETLLTAVGIADPARVAKSYPHQLSGGMCQRVCIAMALAEGPRIIIADEPTTSLDVTVQAQILRLLSQLQQETGAAVLLITHDLGVVARIARRVLVMYMGEAVEYAPVGGVFKGTRHPYTEGLLRSLPRLRGTLEPPPSIPGAVPPLGEIMPGCRFAPRCYLADARCHSAHPELIEAEPGHFVRCFRHQEVRAHG